MVSATGKIKVLIVLPSLHQGGVERQVGYLVKHLDRRRFEVHLAYFKNRDIFYSNLLEEPDETYLLGSGKKTSYDTFWDLVLTLRRVQPQILHLYTESANHLGALASFFAEIPGLIFSVRWTGRTRLQHLLYRLFKRRSKRVIVNSHGIRQELIRHAGYDETRIQVIHNFLDTDRFIPMTRSEKSEAREKFGFQPGEKIFASIGRISHQKNQQGAVRALSLLHRENKIPESFKLLFIGKVQDSGYASDLKKLIQREGLGHLCLFQQPTEDMVSFLNAVDGLFQPTLYEGLPNVVLEAQACGTPVALSREVDHDDLIDPMRTGIHFSNQSDREMAHGLEHLMALSGDNSQREALVKTARESVVRRFSIAEGIQRVQEIYESLSPPPAPR